MSKDLNQAIMRAKELLGSVSNAAIATVNLDGSPHNTPVLLIHDRDLRKIYWSSSPDALHSQNIIRTGELFAVLYEANKGGGLYIQATNTHELSTDELPTALTELNRVRKENGRSIQTIEDYSEGSSQRLYVATVSQLYVNVTEYDNGNFIKSIRQSVTANDLLDH